MYFDNAAVLFGPYDAVLKLLKIFIIQIESNTLAQTPLVVRTTAPVRYSSSPLILNALAAHQNKIASLISVLKFKRKISWTYLAVTSYRSRQFFHATAPARIFN